MGVVFKTMRDLVRLNDLAESIGEAVAINKVMSFSEYVAYVRKLVNEGADISGSRCGKIIYDDTMCEKTEGYIIIGDTCVDEIHDDIISTYDDLFDEFAVRLHFIYDEDINMKVISLLVYELDENGEIINESHEFDNFVFKEWYQKL